MLILGLAGSLNQIYETHPSIGEGNFHDASAALVHDGRLVAAFEEERLIRIKHTNKFPLNAVRACLDSYGVAMEDVDHFAFSVAEENMNYLIRDYLKDKNTEGINARLFLQRLFKKLWNVTVSQSKFEFFDHHYTHAITAFHLSKFEESLVLTIDGGGGNYTGTVYLGQRNELKPLHCFAPEHSLGQFYSHVTFVLGFSHFDEYKVMGLAPYGNPAIYRKVFDSFYTLLPEGKYRLNTGEFWRLENICPSREKNQEYGQTHMDVSASLQEALEKIVFHVVTYYKNKTGARKLCMAGGVALNCTLNGKLIEARLFDDVFVFPAANDSGLPIGATLATYFKYNPEALRMPLKNLYLGNSVGNSDEIKDELMRWSDFIDFYKVDDPSIKAAQLIADDQVIGWVQGRAEFAPRALGNRSILADARPAKNKERINYIIKMREGFRPFAPSVLEEYAEEYFDLPEGMRRFPYMMFILKVKQKYRKHLGAVTHIDGTARLQTVSRDDNPKYWKLIDCFGKLTGTPVILNTSFNNNVEPIVDSAKDAIICFLTTQLDSLVIGDYVVTRKFFDEAQLGKLFLAVPAFIRLQKHEMHMLTPDRRVEITYTISNTFNEKKYTVSGDVFNLLLIANGDKSLDQLMINAGFVDPEKRAHLFSVFLDLWSKRIILLGPDALQSDGGYAKFEHSYSGNEV